MNRREFLKRAGILCTVAVLALYASPGDAADPAPVIVLVTYHSATGNTEKMAQGVAEGQEFRGHNTNFLLTEDIRLN